MSQATEWINKIWYVHTMEDHSNQRERTTETCCNLDEPQKRAELKMPDAKGYVL